MRRLLVLWLVGWAFFSLPWTTFTSDPAIARINWIPFHTRARDQVLNLAYYIPLGVLAVGAGFTPAAVTGAGILLSATTEVAQVFSTDRYPSTTDLVLNSAGTFIGAAVAVAARRRRRSSSMVASAPP
jgi:glycopeptide antibiotics resistance protein